MCSHKQNISPGEMVEGIPFIGQSPKYTLSVDGYF